MAIPFASPIDMNQLEIQNMRHQNLAAAPTSPVEGQEYYNTVSHTLLVYNGTDWVDALTTTPAANSIANSQLAQMPTKTIKGNNTAGTANADDLTVAEVKSMLALENVDNTSDANKPVSTAQQSALDLKVDKVAGKALSTNDYSDAEQTKVGHISVSQAVNLDTMESNIATNNAKVGVTDQISAGGVTYENLNANGDVGTGSTQVSKGDHDHSGVYEPALGFTPEDSANKGTANGYVPLGADSLISSTYLPSYVDDIIEVANYAALPGTGETGKIYVTLDDGLIFRWSGSAYVEISSSLALGETSETAYRGDRGKTAYDHSQTAHAPSNAEANVNADWDATSGDAQILNKPTILSKYSASIGGSTSILVTHNLGSQDVVVSLREVASPYAVIMADIEITSINTVTIGFAVAPTASQYRVTVIG